MKKSKIQLVKVIPLLLLCLAIGCQKQVKEGTTEEEAKVIGDQYVKARNEVNLSLLDEIMDPQIVVHDSSQPETMVGLNALKNQYTFSHTAFPDFHMMLDEMIVKGDKIVWLWTLTGTHTGPFHTPLGDLPPTGKKIRFSGVAIDRVVNGKVAEEWVFFNVLDLLMQLGFTIAPPPLPAKE